MKLHEYQTKSIFRRYDIPVPFGKVAPISGGFKQIAEEINKPVIVKAQVLVGSRSRHGGILLAKTPKEAEEIAAKMLGMDILGQAVNKVLIEESIIFEKEIYLSITLDREYGTPILISSGSGGVDIEDVARRSPEKIFSLHIDPILGLQEFHARMVAVNMDLPQEFWKSFISILQNLWSIYVKYDATLIEINPLVISKENELVALDAKMVIDDNALFRQTTLAESRWLEVENPVVLEARKFGMAYVPLEGNIGCLVNGLGIAMASIDILEAYGGKPATFMNIRGGASAEKTAAAVKIILADPKVEVLLINVYGGITRCDEIARGIISGMQVNPRNIPLVIRLAGTAEYEASVLLKAAGLEVETKMAPAVRRAIELSEVRLHGDSH